MRIKKLSQIDRELNTAACRVVTASLSSLMQMPNRHRFIYQCDDLTVDCTRQPLDDDVLACLFDLAEACQLQKRIDQMFSGAPINTTENRPVQHLEFRRPDHQNTADYKKCVDFTEAVRRNPEITAVVNLGTGGSDLGPKMVTAALAGYHDGPDCYFVGNICPTDLHDVLGKCTPQKTLFIITSKTFTTAETMANAAIAKNWLDRNGVDAGKAMVAVTAAGPRAREWGIDPQHIFTFAEGVGGRYSLWSPVGLAAMIAIGRDDFASLLAGGYAMDCHVQQAELQANIGVIMGLLRVWHRSYLHRPA